MVVAFLNGMLTVGPWRGPQGEGDVASLAVVVFSESQTKKKSWLLLLLLFSHRLSDDGQNGGRVVDSVKTTDERMPRKVKGEENEKVESTTVVAPAHHRSTAELPLHSLARSTRVHL